MTHSSVLCLPSSLRKGTCQHQNHFKIVFRKEESCPILAKDRNGPKIKANAKNLWRRMELTDPSVSVELWRSSTQGETLPRSKICASFPFEHLQRWTEESIIIINCLKGSPWFASFSPRIVIPSVTWWEGTGDTESDGSAKKDLILFYGNRLIEGGFIPFLWESSNITWRGELMIRDRLDLQTKTLHVTCDFDNLVRD